MSQEQISVPMNAARVCDAIARIGYSPTSAIMDIVDNAVTAQASRILIEIIRDPDKVYGSNNGVKSYRIYDNGKGMTDDEIVNALKLGSDANYPSGSLSKYGMGLKSAGFSLGGRVNVVSMKNGIKSLLNYIDRQVIEQKGDYIICRMPNTEEKHNRFEQFLDNQSSGTLIEIENCQLQSQQSAKKTIDQLTEKMGVVYYQFLNQQNTPLKIIIQCTGKPDVHIQPLDILFEEDALSGFDPDNYSGNRPCIVMRREEVPLVPNEATPMFLSVVLFPMANMVSKPGFSEEERQRIKSYKIKRENNGFFIYRNNRLIRWGESLDIVGRDKIGFRARLDLATNHDDQLHVDVSKQHLDFPEEILDKIELLVRLALRQHDQVFSKCREFLTPEEGEKFNERNQDLVEQDYDEPEGASAEQTKRERKKKLEIETTAKISEEEKLLLSLLPDVESIPLFQKIRYSNQVQSMNLWEAGYDPNDGAFVRINKNHSYYSTVLAHLDESNPSREAIEAILWCCAAAENLTRTNLSLDDAQILQVLNKFKKLFAVNLDNWSTVNQDLFDYDH